MVSYKKIITQGILKKPFRTITSTLSTILHKERANLPFKLKLECSSICNLKCKMCPLSDGLKRKQGFLKFANFKKIFDEIDPVYLNLTGIGEPLLNKDLFKIVKYGKLNGAMIKFDTNAALLDEENIRKILDTKIDIVSISIDGVDKEGYESIRVGANFELMKENVKNLTKIRNELKSKTEIHMFFVLQKENIENLPEFILLAEELGVDYVAGSFVVTLGDNKNETNKITRFDKSYQALVTKTREIIKKVKVEVGIDPLLQFITKTKEKEHYNQDKPCFMPWYSTFITWDGWVNPCDFSCDNEIVFGNVFEESFKTIWNNKKYRKFRKDLLYNRKSIPLCKDCGVDESYISNEIKKIPFIKK
jgi:radical SAM protein with 4Fe4S-binding SPASM domain